MPTAPHRGEAFLVCATQVRGEAPLLHIACTDAELGAPRRWYFFAGNKKPA